MSGAAADPGGTSLPPHISEEKHSSRAQKRTTFVVKRTYGVSSLRRLLLKVGSCSQSVSGPLYQRTMFPSPSCLWSLGGGALLPFHTASPARPFSNLSDRSDTSGVCVDRENKAFYKEQHTGGQPLRPRPGHVTHR